MAARGDGHLVFISSLSGKAASAGGSVYSATKFGLRGFALGLREDLRGTGVGVSIVFPGFIRDAGMFHDSGVEAPALRRHEHARATSPTAVVRAIERDRAEVDVAPLSMRVGAALAGLLPELSGRVQRRLGSDQVAEAMAEGSATSGLAEAGGEQAEVVGQGAVGELGDARAQDGDGLAR